MGDTSPFVSTVSECCTTSNGHAGISRRRAIATGAGLLRQTPPGSGSDRFEPWLVPTGQRSFDHSLLEQLGGITQPGLVDVSDRHVDGFDVGGLGDGSQRVQDGAAMARFEQAYSTMAAM